MVGNERNSIVGLVNPILFRNNTLSSEKDMVNQAAAILIFKSIERPRVPVFGFDREAGIIHIILQAL